jgi:hypothetical protein
VRIALLGPVEVTQAGCRLERGLTSSALGYGDANWMGQSTLRSGLRVSNSSTLSSAATDRRRALIPHG